ncbi:hypothetical protein C804_01037 [Lachnospiraceae bacterium A4]|nr:hypothetical protein C804_01037 [Lachnospiraceae bacterium A4]
MQNLGLFSQSAVDQMVAGNDNQLEGISGNIR